jgi:hypothetical protein
VLLTLRILGLLGAVRTLRTMSNMWSTAITRPLSCLTRALSCLSNLGLLTLVVSSYFDLLITLLICIDVVGVPIVSPQDSEGEMGDPDAMMVDDAGE